MQNTYFIKLVVGMIVIGLLPSGCHSTPPPAPPSQPEPVVPDTDEEIPEVVSNKLDLTGDNFAGCSLYKDAAEKIWGYRVQADLNLSVQVYEDKIDAADAEKLMNMLNEFTKGWLARFKGLCEHNEKGFLAPEQFNEGAGCLSDLLGLQKDYVNGLFHKRQFETDEAAAVGAHLTDCDLVLEPRGEKALLDNPF